MKKWFLLGALLVGPLMAIPAIAQDKGLEERVKKLEEAVQEYKEHEKRERERGEVRMTEPGTEPGVGPLPDVAKERRADKQPALSFGSTGSGRLVYAKPFVAAPKAIIGGYMDIQYRAQKQNIGNGYGGTTNTFDQQRFVPFFYADITEHVKMAAELEIEHGIRETSGGNDLEIGLEFAHIDYLIHEPLNLRAGIILLPVGKFNLLHDSPLNDLTDRPLVNRFVIPTTMAETGVGIYGTFYPGRLSKVDYELYFTTGPCGTDANGTPRINEEDGTRGSRQRKCPSDDGLDINNGKAVVGRVAYSPMLGVEVAGSGYYGNAAPYSNYNPLSIMALDWTFQRGPFELLGEAAWAYARHNSRAIAGNTIGAQPGDVLTGQGGNINPDGTPPQRSNGFYIQGNYHFMPQWLARWSPKRFGEGSTFTAVLRYDRVNTNLDYKPGGAGDLEQISFGLNYRPIEDAAFKMSYQYQPMAFNSNSSMRVHDQALVISAATYF
ncbi:MAG: TonB-dependent receptor [Nitrospiraceae bacterium]